MKLIYVAGKYRADTEFDLVMNIRKAETAAIRLWKNGWAVICPHKNTAHLGGALLDRTVLDGDLEMLKRCDAIFMLFGWEKSCGAIHEHQYAKDNGLEVYFETDGFPFPINN